MWKSDQTLIALTIEEAQQLSPEHQVPSEVEAKPWHNNLLDVLEADLAEPSVHETISRIVDAPSMELDTENLTACPTSEVFAGPEPNSISKSTPAAPSISPDVPGDRDRFSLSIFTIEVDGKPTLAFEAKRYSEAEAICQGEQLRTKLSALGSGDFPLVPGENAILVVRLANRDEAARYKQAAAGSDSTDDLLLVYLVELDGKGQ
jgi:hypothetical protein